jgi:hypothetical protein
MAVGVDRAGIAELMKCFFLNISSMRPPVTNAGRMKFTSRCKFTSPSIQDDCSIILEDLRAALSREETVDKGALVREDRSVGLDPEAYRN